MLTPITRLTTALTAALFSILTAAASAQPILWSTDVSADGSLVATSGKPTHWLYNTETLEPDPRAKNLPDAQATAVSFHPTKNILAISAYDEDTDNPIHTGLYNIDTQTFTPIPIEEGARGIDFNHDATLLALSETTGAVSVWTVTDEPMQVYYNLPENAKSLTGVAWNPTKDTLVTIGEYITLHDLTTEEPKEPIRWKHRPDTAAFSLPLSVAWHPTGKFFIVSDYGHNEAAITPAITFWSHAAQHFRTVEHDGQEIRNVRWSPDGSRFAATSDQLLVYNKDGKLLHASPAPDHDPNLGEIPTLWGVAWSKDANWIFTTDLSGKSARWDAKAANPVYFGQ